MTWFKKNWFLLFLLTYAFAVRFLYPLTDSFSFGFDHGKDSLGVLEMLVLRSPKLVGPWTSIPGLFFGPAWYYYLGGTFLLGNFSPAAPVWGMVILGLIQVYLAYRYFGKTTSAIVASASLWLTVTTSAWNPFPLTLISWLLLIILSRTAQTHKITPVWAFSLGFIASLGFHFSSAYAIFYPLIILLCLLYQKLKLTRKTIFIAALGFIIPFLPQIAFELRHDFNETRAVISYFGQGGEAGDQFGLPKITQVLSSSWNEIKLAVTPDINFPTPHLAPFISAFFILILLGCLFNFSRLIWQKKLDLPPLFVESWLFILLPLLGFCFLHFNLWYLLGLMPASVILVGQILDHQPQKFWASLWITAVLLGGVTVNFREFLAQDIGRPNRFYRQVSQAWSTIKTLSQGKNFALYTYQNDIYDFAYQYLILRDGLVNHLSLPQEFSYQAGEISYVPEKAALLARTTPLQGPVESIFYLLDNPDPAYKYFQEWQGQHPDFARATLVKTFGTNLQLYQVTKN